MGNILHLEQFSFTPARVFDLERFNRPDLALHVSPSFRFRPADRIFVMGSCFAAEVRRALNARGFAATDAGQGHKYNTFSMLQALDWALNDSFDERFLAPLKDGRAVDCHRNPTLIFDTAAAGVAEHRALLKKMREELLAADVVVLTLGLVEVWRDAAAGVWLNQTPPMKQVVEPDRFQVHATTHAQNLQAFQTLLQRLREVNPSCRVVCSASPVPLKATFCGDDVLVANCYSKSTLRSVASEAMQAARKDHGMVVDYFPAYELATLRPRDEVWSKTIRNNEPDGRHVRREFIDSVIMKLFLDRYVEAAAPSIEISQVAPPPPAEVSRPAAPAAAARRVLCNSWPKAGTHVLLEMARLALGDGEWYKDWDIKYRQGESEFAAKFTERLRRYEGQSFAIKGHYGRTPAVEAFLAEHRFAHLFAVRDPREVLCSTQRWLRDLRRGWAISKHLAPLDPAAQLEQIIVGLPLLDPFDLDFAVRWDRPLPGRYAALTAWLDAPGCCVLAYEDLSGKRGAAAQLSAIERALRQMQVPFDHADLVRIAGLICNPKTATFHTGPASNWETVFTDRHRHLFVENGGEALVERLGYPATFPARSRAPRQPAAEAAAASAPQGSAVPCPTLPPAIRIVTLDEEARHAELFGDAFGQLGLRAEPGGNRSAEEIMGTKPDAILLSREWSHRWRLTAAAARRAGVPVIYVMDGVIEWSYVWNNLSFVKPEGTVLQPLLASHLCVVGRHPARILAGLGLADRIHVVGLPRLDGFSKTRVVERGQAPRILVLTAKTYAHNTEQKVFVRRALRDLKSWFEANPFVVPVWRIADEAAEDIGVSVQRDGSLEQALATASGVISFSSTCLLEAMLKGIPTAQVDYRAVPLYVQTAWEIRSAEQIPAVIQELLYPPPERVAFQEQCLEDELEPGNASERLARAIQQAIAESRNPMPKPQGQPVANFGRLDFHQVHSQLSAFSASLQSPVQYELEALQNLYDRARRELQAARQELQKTRPGPAQAPQPFAAGPAPHPQRNHTVRPVAVLQPATLPMGSSRADMSAPEAALMNQLRRDSGNADALSRLGLLQMKQRRFMEASRTFGKLLDHKPDDLPAALCRVTCEMEQGDWVAARLNCLRALKIDPNNADAKTSLAFIEARNGSPPLTETKNSVEQEAL